MGEVKSVMRPTGCLSHPWRQRSSSTPENGRKQDWTMVNGKVNSKPPKQLGVKLKNRLTSLSENPGSLLHGHPSQGSRVRIKHPSNNKWPERKLKAETETVILDDLSVKDLHRFCRKNTKVLCYPKDIVNDVQES